MADSIILMILALVVFGPRKLPQIGRQIGKLMYEFRKASNDFKFQMEEELRLSEEAERKAKEEAQRQKALTEQAAVHAQPAQLPEASADTLVDPTAESVPEVHLPRVAEPVSVSAGSVSSGPVLRPPSTGDPIAAARPGVGTGAPGEVTLPKELETSSTETVAQNG